ncbi:chromosome segregation protein SMC [Halobacteriales archaeon QS_1_68_17]|nr:MAG: chromosome segregation protein SMC [Halobacteriales archaeon QS_1_68_17]
MSRTVERAAEVRVERLGGIEETDVRFAPGVTALVGRNATNRTSLLEAVMAACGSDAGELKGDADRGRVELRIGERTFAREFRERDGTVSATGDGYLDDATVADLFAFLLESNRARRAVARGDDLREIIMEPVDTDAIEAEIDRLEAEKRDVERELETVEELADRLPELTERRSDLDGRIERKREALASKRDALDDVRAEVAETRSAGVEEKLDELRAKRRELERIRSDIDIEETTAVELRAEIEDLEAEREELSDAPTEAIEDLDDRIDRLREQKHDAEAAVNDLQRIIRFNEEMLDGTEVELLEEQLGGEGDAAAVAETVVCWTCGSEVDREAVELILDRLRGVRKEKLNEAHSLETRLDERRAERRELERQRERAERIDGKIASIRRELEDTEATIRSLEAQRDELEGAIETLESDVAAMETEAYDRLRDLQAEIQRLEVEIERLRDDREEVDGEIDRIEARIAERAELERRRAAIADDIVAQRTRIERTEAEAVEQFNAQMEDLLDRLAYGNLERIWLEPRETDGEGQGDAARVFELHVVRRTESGDSYEDAINHLSESEREITGIVFALAGYLAHEVYEEVPFLLLDSLEAIDSDRIATLIDYVRDYSQYVVVALLPEDARALDGEYHRITDI